MPEAPICVRWTFDPARAEEFIDPIIVNGTESQPHVVQIEYDSIDEIMEILNGFGDAITDANAIINGQVINLSDHPNMEDEA